jgi:hypothetical protein
MATRARSSHTGAEEHGEDLLVVASTPDEGIEGVLVELVVPAVNHALPHFLLSARMPLPRRTGTACDAIERLLSVGNVTTRVDK